MISELNATRIFLNDCAEFANGAHKGLDIDVLHIPAFGNALRRGGTAL